MDTDPFVGHTASVEDLQVSNLLKEEANDPDPRIKLVSSVFEFIYEGTIII